MVKYVKFWRFAIAYDARSTAASPQESAKEFPTAKSNWWAALDKPGKVVLVGTPILVGLHIWSGQPVNTMASGTTPDDMLAEWSIMATGENSHAGFALEDGTGIPGSPCIQSGGRRFFVFGPAIDRNGGGPHAGALVQVSDAGVATAKFWFNNQSNTLALRGIYRFSVNAEPTLPDMVLPVQGIEPGRISINGQEFHTCAYRAPPARSANGGERPGSSTQRSQL